MKTKIHTLAELAKITHSKLVGNAKHQIKSVSELENASNEDAAYLAHPRYEKDHKTSQAGVIFIAPSFPLIQNKNYLINDDPTLAINKAITAIYLESRQHSGFSSIHSTAVIHESASIGKQVTIGPNAVIDKDVSIDDQSYIGAGSYIGPNSRIGTKCKIHPNATIREQCTIGHRVNIGSGAVIGNEGFGYSTDNQGHHTHLPHIGAVIIEDDVDIGANTIIDHGRIRPTLIKRGTKINNLVQIGHGAQIGEDNLIVAFTAVAGSVKTGRLVMIGGQSGIPPNLEITDYVQLAGKSGVTKSITKSGKYGGFPALPISEYNRQQVIFRNLEKTVKELHNRIDSITKANQ